MFGVGEHMLGGWLEFLWFTDWTATYSMIMQKASAYIKEDMCPSGWTVCIILQSDTSMKHIDNGIATSKWAWVRCTAITELCSNKCRNSGILNHINLWIFLYVNITLKLLLILNFLAVYSEGVRQIIYKHG